MPKENLENLRKVRLEKLKEISKKGFNPYPSQTKRTHTCQEAILDFGRLTERKTAITLVGRLKNIRLHGGSCFCHLQDGSGMIQIYLKKDILNKKLQTTSYPGLAPRSGAGKLQAVNYDFFRDLIDIGDFIQATGTLFETKKGEKTLLVKEFKLLAKSLLPLPEKWHGLQDVEIRYRKRYLDLISSPEVKEIFQKRSLIIKTLRKFLDKHDFFEVETPVLQPIPGGATARPFKTHHNALDIDLYLRIAPELYLKRLLVGGFEKIYEFARCFRNEGIDWSHNPEFTNCEFYWAYKDYQDLMNFTEEFVIHLIKEIKKQEIKNSELSLGRGKVPKIEIKDNNSLKIKYKNNILDFSQPWSRKKFKDVIKENCSIDITKISKEDLIKKMKELNIESDYKAGLGKLYDDLYKDIILQKIIQPTIIYDYPIEMEPLAKRCEGNPCFVQRFQLIIAGLELAKAYTELNDPIDQLTRFKEQQKLREKGDEEAQVLDKDFIQALEHGLPPCVGWGLGIDRLSMLLADVHNLKEVILFPTMRPRR